MSQLTSHERSTAAPEGKYLLFELAGEQFGMDVMRVKEIIGMHPITAVPHAPGYVKGVINLRGKIVPVIDLRLRFHLAPRDYGPRTCTIVVEFPTASGPALIGVVVDAVTEVAFVPEGLIEAAPEFPDAEPQPYLRGMAKLAGRVGILLAIEEVLAAPEAFNLAAIAREASRTADTKDKGRGERAHE